MPGGSNFVQLGRKGLAKYLKENITHFAVGRGTWQDKQNPPSPTFGQIELTDEIGRIPITQIDYLVENINGTISHDGKMWSISEVGETNTIQIVAAIPPNAINGEGVCELGYFGDGVEIEGNANYYQPRENVTNIGRLYVVENFVEVPIINDQTFQRKFRLTL